MTLDPILTQCISFLECRFFFLHTFANSRVQMCGRHDGEQEKNQENCSTIVSSMPEEWLKIYREKGYEHADYPLQQAQTTHLPFLWGEAHNKNITPLQEKIYRHAQDFEIYQGIAIPLWFQEKADTLILVFGAQEKLTAKRLYEKGGTYQMIGHIFTLYHRLQSVKNPELLLEELQEWMGEMKKIEDVKKARVRQWLMDIRLSRLFLEQHQEELAKNFLYEVSQSLAQGIS